MDLRFRYDNAKLYIDRRMQVKAKKGMPRKEKSKKEKEGTGRSEKLRDTDGSKKRVREDHSRPNYRRKKKERSRREGERIRESKYNIQYKKIAKEELPKCIEKRMKWKDRRILAKFRRGNETKTRECWKEEGEKRCRLCKRKEENLRYVIEKCEITGGPKDIEKTLNETGEGLIELKAIIEKRRVIQDGEE